MQIGVPRETRARETRVAATPKTVGQLVALGYDVVVERGAGEASSFSDEAYVVAGARVVTTEDAWASEIVHKVNAPADAEVAMLRPGAVLVSLLSPALNPDLVEKLRDARVTAMAMDAVPRISRAQSLDVLSSMANIAGYRAVVEAANVFGSFFTGQVTAAGKIPPAKVLVAGAGVAGLAAIGAAGSLGAIVRATDPRPEVADQVRSLGGEYLAIESPEAEVSATGYAKEMGEDYQAREAQLYADQTKDVDIIITTALIPGRPAPRLVTADMVATMRPGSVIVDMAASNGGNVEGSVPDEMVVTSNGVKIIGFTDLAARLPTQASQLYGTNLVNLMKLLTPGKDGQLVLDFDDVVQRGMTATRDGELLWPPPAIQVSAAPVAKPAAEVVKVPEKVKDPRRKYVYMAIGAVAFALIAAFAPASFLGHFTVFALAVVVGYYVIGNVHHALHTPLMSVTNAISGIIIVGALIQLGQWSEGLGLTIFVLAFLATLIASINIFGGFLVTRRMLTMFRKG
ncbi:MAG TPA: Re/Si-specific NAD(P)(+) transhydrogenase subunit alpha [Intrasporangium sp.]|uniref:Re/Si-specific NAD(P)(+) transhydrogenase subunit alpha n=1 Tax=Intrasporangium sp. TaxID=1925024 RepID=UPI002B48D103|nr:Re/Si-specific NAD(P)(+) transhydrogenase subunit alpha [Intrasporangium sp.]HKX67408.1 Re/Si-specific NAD(P)(+) transhydrogenase subunit alpha [Intrasporangium sp.]